MLVLLEGNKILGGNIALGIVCVITGIYFIGGCVLSFSKANFFLPFYLMFCTINLIYIIPIFMANKQIQYFFDKGDLNNFLTNCMKNQEYMSLGGEKNLTEL